MKELFSEDLLRKTFTNVWEPLTLEEAKKKAELFFRCVLHYGLFSIAHNDFEDYWIQIAENWDLNIFDGQVFADDDMFHGTLYIVNPDGTTETEKDFIDITDEFYKD